MYSQKTGLGGTSIYDPFSIAACNALLFIPITFYALNRPLPIATVLNRPHLYRANAHCRMLNLSTVMFWFVRALFQSVVTYLLVDMVLSSGTFPEGHAVCYSEIAVASFSLFLIIQCGNLTLETTTFTLLQTLALLFGLVGSLLFYMVFNDMVAAQKLVDYHALFHICAHPSTILLAPLVTVAALAPVVACKYCSIYVMSDRERAPLGVAPDRLKGAPMAGAV